MYRIRTLERNYPNHAVISQYSITALTKTTLIITCRMFSRCNDSEDCNRTLRETFSCLRQLTRLVVLVLSRVHCDCYTSSVCILIQISAEPLILTHRTQFKNYCSKTLIFNWDCSHHIGYKRSFQRCKLLSHIF